jgi:hypothetical protein
MHLPSTWLLLALALPTAAPPLCAAQKIRDGIVTYPDGYVVELGEPGELPPPLQDAGSTSAPVVLNGAEPPVPAPFLGGGANQRLLALSASANGFSAAWSDSRDGNIGLFVGFLDPAGEHPVDGAPVHLPRSSRQVLPDLAQAPWSPKSGILGGIVWTAQEMKSNLAMLRFFACPKSAGTGERASAASLLDLPIPLGPLDELAQVRLALAGDVGIAAWAGGGKLGGVPIRLDEESGSYTAKGRLLLVDEVHPVGGLFELALDAEGHALVVWSEADPEDGALHMRLAACDLTAKAEPTLVDLGLGRPLGLATDTSGGFWLLKADAEGLALAHFEPDGTTTEDLAAVRVAGPEVTAASLATWGLGDGIAVLAEGGIEADAVRLHIYGPDGRRLTPEAGFDALDEGAVDPRGAKLAAIGTSFLVAWTDSRADLGDVFYRLIELTDPTRAAVRWNQDQGSADQVHAALDSNGRQALVAWEDGRRGTPEIFVRALGSRTAGEIELGREGPLQSEPSGPQVFPTVALGADGRGLVTWKEDLGSGGWILRGQFTDTTGSPLGEPRDLDPLHTARHEFPAACLALPRNAGFLVGWVRPDESGAKGASNVMVRRFDDQGRARGAAQALVTRGTTDARNVAMTLGTDGSVLVVWDQIAITAKRVVGKKKPKLAQARALAGRFVTPTGSPLGQLLSFPPSPEGGDSDPVVTTVLGGGYLLAWTGDEGPTRDVFARFLTSRAKPEGPPLAISVRSGEQDYPALARMPNGRLFVVWEDDISGADHGFLREIQSVPGRAGRRAELGPRLLVDTQVTAFVEDRHAPLAAPLGRGLVLVWDDLGRGRGHDVAARYWLPD